MIEFNISEAIQQLNKQENLKTTYEYLNTLKKNQLIQLLKVLDIYTTHTSKTKEKCLESLLNHQKARQIGNSFKALINN